jgi:hypothetical protein
MLKRTALLLMGLLVSSSAFAADPKCVDATEFKAMFKPPNSSWVDLTPGQFHFIEGFWVGFPSTPPGPPPGDHGVLAHMKGDKGSAVIILKGAKICSVLPVTPEVVKMLNDVKTGPLDASGEEM